MMCHMIKMPYSDKENKAQALKSAIGLCKAERCGCVVDYPKGDLIMWYREYVIINEGDVLAYKWKKWWQLWR